MRKFVPALAALTLFLPPNEALARNIVLTNDDGLTSNVVALYRALKEQGHDVIVSVPCGNQSGMGAAIWFARPLAPLASDCKNGAAKAGGPGAAQMTREGFDQGDFHYVDGTPVMAMLYGIDVVAARRWGTEPDLVLSGPNEGQNVGAIILSSGTVSNAQIAAVRGLPAIALSAGSNTTDDDQLANPNSAAVARLSAELVDALDERSNGGPLLPAGIALNVNFPDELDGATWKISRIGNYNAYKLRFVEDMAEEASPMIRAMARERGAELPPLPGIDLDMNGAAPRPEQLEDESIVYRQDIAVSPMQAGYGYAPAASGWLNQDLREILDRVDD